MQEVCNLFLEKLIPMFERWFGDDWVDIVDYDVKTPGVLKFKFRRFIHEEKINRVIDTITSWFGERITSISDVGRSNRFAVTFQTEASGALATA